jgi:hypothetical protein
MTIRDDLKQLKTGDRDLRKFGLLVGGVFAAFGVIALLRHKAHYPYSLWPGGALVLLGAIIPRALKYVYLAWMSVAFVLGFVISHLILGLFFFLVITPIGLVARLFGKDFLSLKLDRSAASYWIPRERKPKTPAEHEQQF